MAKSGEFITINCASDPALAKAIYDYLLTFQVVDKNDIVLETDEIYVSSNKNRNITIDAISSFMKSNKDYQGYQITEFGDIIMVGVPRKPEQLMDNILTCDMCNYMTPYEEQLMLHRMTHGNVMIG